MEDPQQPAREVAGHAPRDERRLAVDDHGTVDAWYQHFPGQPPDVLHATRVRALRALLEHLRG